MAHYTIGKTRLSTREGATAPEWYKVCSQIGSCVNIWSGREDLVVYGGKDSAEGQAVAAYYADIAEIEINVDKAFAGFQPHEVGDFREKSTHYEFPTQTGIIYHEALHARYTTWDMQELQTRIENQAVAQAFMGMEESRIEGLGVKLIPAHKGYLRASGLEIALEDLTEEYLSTMSNTWQVANLALLSLARFDSGVLEASDVADIRKRVVETLGEELYQNLRQVWIDFQALVAPADIDKGIELAEKFVELLREADPEGEPENQGAREPARASKPA